VKRERRTFLKQVGLTSLGLSAAAEAAPGPQAAYGEPARGLTLCTLRRGGRLSLGLRGSRGILDVAKAEAAFHLKAPVTDTEFFERGGAPALQALLARAEKDGPADLFLDAEKADLGPCVTRPEKIICVGLNYRKHAAETGQAVPETPILFNKYNTALCGHRAVVRVSQEDAVQFDYEVELVLVMGRVTRNVTEAEALDHVFGYCTGNDFSARDLQRRTSQWMLGKALDHSAPIGPWLVGAGLVPDPNALRLECRVNGQVRQSSSTADMVFDCRKLVAYISRYLTLKPGDVIFTGTPEGVIGGYPKEKQVWLKPGDVVASSIEGLGELLFTLA
jgi:2-keto-4-pentenoate hydratase/2-oxohepta-3-ene-1,7-dioic acid hydratase in catechol pathway